MVIFQYVFSHQDVNTVALLLRSYKMKRAGRKVQNSVASGIAYEGCMLRLEASARLPWRVLMVFSLPCDAPKLIRVAVRYRGGG